LVMAIAVFMILNQLGIAQTIVNATYIALIGAVALGAALAFGLGGRDAAADLINSGYRKAQQNSDQVRRDFRTGRERAEADARAYAPNGLSGQGNGGAHDATVEYAAPPPAPQTTPTPPEGTPAAAGATRPGDPYGDPQPGVTEPVAPSTPPRGGPRR
ncbi:hypothetical protein ACFPK1_31345, partial [Actinomycetospora rhizophila]